MAERAGVVAATFTDPEAFRARVVRERFGFIDASETARLAALDVSRLWQVLVRCGRCRFICAVQDVEFLIAAVEKNGDYVRDVAFTNGGGR